MSWCRSVWVYLIWDLLCFLLGFPRWLSGSTCNARARDVSLVSGLGKCPGGEHDNPLRYSCVENPMNRAGYLFPFIGLGSFQP